jgi:PAS domain S-box-containing protein
MQQGEDKMLAHLHHALYEEILNHLSDGIYISNHEGITLWVNKASAAMCHVPPSELVGRSVWDLEKAGVFTPSVTRLALEAGNTVSTVQSMRDGRKYLVTGHLIRNAQGDVELVVAHSRDITEAVRTTSQLEETERLLRRYSQEILSMKLEQKKVQTTAAIIGRSKSYLALLDLIDKVAEVDTTVLITGETGVGKSVIAKRIHERSKRHDKPFLQINCGAIPESLIESELFGYKKGAFTGACMEGKVGLVKMADKGTLFLDEIGELPLHLQSKILQFLQEKTYLPIGDTHLHSADVRIIAATNRNLAEMMRENKFRPDLYYRLNILPIHVPPLRERQEDILQLLYFYLNKFNDQYLKKRTFSSKVLQILQNYNWPGNIRELENLIERLVITAAKDEISVEDLPDKVHPGKTDEEGCITLMQGESLPQMVERIEKEAIVRSLTRQRSTRKAAKELGITQSALMRRLKKYNLKVERIHAE